MVKSMTGYGKSINHLTGRDLVIYIKALNSKGLDINLKTSGNFKEVEIQIRDKISSKLLRGKIDVQIIFETPHSNSKLKINKPLLKEYFKDIDSIKSDLNISTEGLLSTLLKMPNVLMEETEHTLNKAEVDFIFTHLNSALLEVEEFRKKEGHNLAADVVQNIGHIKDLLKEIEKIEKDRFKRIRARIKKDLHNIIDSSVIDHNRFEQELIYYLEKLDISEEKVRLSSHCDYFFEVVNSDEPMKGKKLGFISQEIGREINTIGSKANDKDIQKFVVQMKNELEKIKEQVANIL